MQILNTTFHFSQYHWRKMTITTIIIILTVARFMTMSSRRTLGENAWTCFTCFSWRASRDAWRQPSVLRGDLRLCECVYCQKSLRYSREFCGSLFISHKVKNVSSQKINTVRFFSQHWINRHLDFNSPLLKERGKITQKLLSGKG